MKEILDDLTEDEIIALEFWLGDDATSRMWFNVQDELCAVGKALRCLGLSEQADNLQEMSIVAMHRAFMAVGNS